MAAVVFGYAIWTFNRLVGLSKRADGGLERHRRAAQTAVGSGSRPGRDGQGICRHESSTLEHVVEARGQAVQSASIAERGAREQNLSAAVSRLFAVAEAYPDLKATQNFQDLQRNLVEIENNIQYARRYYNAVVRDWNTLVESIPSCWVAVAAGYAERPYFQLDDAERAAPRVSFDASRGPGSIKEPQPRAQASRH